MKLFIDTSASQKTVLGLGGRRWKYPTKAQKSQQLLSLIEKILKKCKASIDKITEIEVNLGPGSFTGLKVGVAVANTLGWALKVPINSRPVGKLVEPKYK